MPHFSSQHSDVAGSFSGSKEFKAGPHQDANLGFFSEQAFYHALICTENSRHVLQA